MIKKQECGKICLVADEGKMLCNASINTYAPKAYLFSESEESEWVEVNASDVPQNADISDSEALAIILGGSA